MSRATLENPFAGQGSVLLDIGDDVGALVVTMPTEMVGQEVDIEGHPAGQGHGHDHDGERHRPHVAVVARPVAGGSVPSLVYPELVEGTYRLMWKGTDDVRLTIRIRGGEVTTADWPR
jgi:hypothetical protein